VAGSEAGGTRTKVTVVAGIVVAVVAAALVWVLAGGSDQSAPLFDVTTIFAQNGVGCLAQRDKLGTGAEVRKEADGGSANLTPETRDHLPDDVELFIVQCGPSDVILGGDRAYAVELAPVDDRLRARLESTGVFVTGKVF